MKIDFLNTIHKEPARDEAQFGLCDDQNGQKAYSDIDNPNNWIAVAKNPDQISLSFTPVDKCLLTDSDLPGTGRCDGIITSANHILFVELKDQKSHWVSGAKKQLEDTIILFKANHDISAFKHKKAYACNKARPRFQEIDNEENKRFFRQHGVRLDVQSNILIVK